MPIICKSFIAPSKGNCSSFHLVLEERSFKNCKNVKRNSSYCLVCLLITSPGLDLEQLGTICFPGVGDRRTSLHAYNKKEVVSHFLTENNIIINATLKYYTRWKIQGLPLANSARKLSFPGKTAVLVNSRILQRPRTITGTSNR